MRVLITGGSGTIGTAWVRRNLHTHSILSVCRTARGAGGLAYDTGVASTLCDVASPDFLWVVRNWKPDVVIHAAALKYVDLCEKQPARACEINVGGTLNVIRACQQHGAPRLVLVSTDKAESPVNVYGQTKRLAECMVTEAGGLVVRLANVLGSQGSVLDLWRRSKRAGRPLPITNPDMRRFWMSPQQAADAIEDAVRDGVAPVLSPRWATVGDLSQVVGGPVEVVGPRPGERIHEAMRPDWTTETAPRMSMADLEALCHESGGV